jgi:paraquat-inducible protein B
MVGSFVLGGITIAVAALIALGGGQLFADVNRASVFFEGSVNGLVIGSPVKIEGVPVGKVVQIRAILDETDAGEIKTHTETVIEIDPRRFEQTVTNPDEVRRVGQEGAADDPGSPVRARLNMQSLLTGQLYVALSISPEIEGYVGPDNLAQYPQIPSIPTTFEVIEATARDFLERFRSLPLEELVQDTGETIVAVGDLARDPAFRNAARELEQTLRETRELVTNLDGQVEPLSAQALVALQELETTLSATARTLEPGSPVVYQLGATLQEVSQAAQALRALANTLERQPNAVVFGKGEPSE